MKDHIDKIKDYYVMNYTFDPFLYLTDLTQPFEINFRVDYDVNGLKDFFQTEKSQISVYCEGPETETQCALDCSDVGTTWFETSAICRDSRYKCCSPSKVKNENKNNNKNIHQPETVKKILFCINVL